MEIEADEGGSAGHLLGQLVGNWYERYVAYPVLSQVADTLGLYCDSRFRPRTCRGDKLIWEDSDGNGVDYDFIFELGGTDDHRGIPVAFFETFWRRGSRHSKDKARDDSGKLLGMRDAFPTARLLGIVAAGDFTRPAQELIRSRHIDLFYTSKEKVLSAWQDNGVVIDYPDKLGEDQKRTIATAAQAMIAGNSELLQTIADSVINKIGAAEIKAFTDRVAGHIGATPQEYRIFVIDQDAKQFWTRAEVDQFLLGSEPALDSANAVRVYAYEVLFGDGDSFSRDDLEWRELRELHSQLDSLVEHMERLAGG